MPTITPAALIKRIQRDHAKRDLRFCRSRSAGERAELGDYYILDTRHDEIIAGGFTLEDFARERGFLESWETL